MSDKLKAILQKLEAADLAILGQELVPAVFDEIEVLSKSNATVSAIEMVVFPAVEPAAQAALASLIAKIPA